MLRILRKGSTTQAHVAIFGQRSRSIRNASKREALRLNFDIAILNGEYC